MAEGTSLRLQFETMAGLKTWTFNNAKPSAGLQNVRTLMQAMITNGSIFENPPIRAYSAKEVTTTETEYNLNS